MTLAQAIYLGLVAIYAVLFGLFLRLFVWKHYAYKNSWSKRPTGLSRHLVEALAAAGGRDLPRFSIFVPARNEAEVIERTIEHLAELDYPATHYEVIIATDEKERLAAEEDREGVIADLAEFLTGEGAVPASESRAAQTLIGLLSLLALQEGALIRRHGISPGALKAARSLAPDRQVRALIEVSAQLLRSRGWVNARRLQSLFLRRSGSLPAGEARRLFPIFVSLAMPVAIAYGKLSRDRDERMVSRMMAKAARASHPLTQNILQAMTDTLSHRLVERLTRLRKNGQLQSALVEAYDACFPTTLTIVDQKIAEWAAEEGRPALIHAVVPYDFDGEIGGRLTGRPVPSTKGRALNYAVGLATPQAEMFGFYDAESRPDPRVLLYAAYRRLQAGEQAAILQGPVFQVRNFYELRPINKIAALYQSISHDWVLPNVFKHLPFVGGTNLFIDRALLYRIGGYDDTSLTEDVELGIRAYMETGAWPEYLPYPSSEQTPTTFLAFYRQRLRWGSGYLQVYDKLNAATQYADEKRRPLLRTLFIRGHLEWSLYQAAAFLPFVVWILWSANLIDASILPLSVRSVLGMVSLVYLSFTFYAFLRYSPHLDAARGEHPLLRQAFGIAQLLLLPVSAFFLPVPYSSALLLKALGRTPRQWVKTPRTQE